jgi:hypothetical protein
MSEPVVVLDAGVIDQVVTNREFRAVLEELVRSGWTPVIPTPVLSEAITGGATDAPANQAINRIGTTATDEPLAPRRCAALRRQRNCRAPRTTQRHRRHRCRSCCRLRGGGRLHHGPERLAPPPRRPGPGAGRETMTPVGRPAGGSCGGPVSPARLPSAPPGRAMEGAAR